VSRWEDYGSHTEEDAGRWARAHAEDDDRPSRSDLSEEDFRTYRSDKHWTDVWGDKVADAHVDREEGKRA
jgi:hypothetical protein